MKQQFLSVCNADNNHCAANIFRLADKQEGNLFYYPWGVVEQRTQADGSVCRQSTVLRNTGESKLYVARQSSYFTREIAPAFALHDVKMHFCHSAWQGEGQWVTLSPREFGIYPASAHENELMKKSLDSLGSWSTSKYYPLVFIEDKTAGKTWFYEHLGAVHYSFEFGAFGWGASAAITLEISCLNDSVFGSGVWLQPGESFESTEVLYGCADGGVDEAVALLLAYKRSHGRQNARPLCCFNDYMNCLWAMPSDKKLLPLIDAAARVGAEVFCIDDGWFQKQENAHFGDWIPEDSLFGENGLQGIIDYIAGRGMLPGIWLEMETAMPQSALSKLNTDAMLRRNGEEIERGRGYVNFCNGPVCEYLYNRIRRLYQMGIRYIKNDYNHNLGVGCDLGDGDLLRGLHRTQRAFLRFCDRLQRDFPDLILENCGSGAMRCDFGTLSHFALQSISDQEIFTENPSVVYGALRCIQPEKCGIWCYPYPLPFERRNDAFDAVFDAGYRVEMAAGTQTAFNMATALFGIPFLSGHIEYADEYNSGLIKKALDIFKANREFICRAVPVTLYPQQPLFANGYTVLALTDAQKLRIGIFAVDAAEELCLELEGRISENAALTEIYPGASAENPAFLQGTTLICRGAGKTFASVFEIRL